MLITIFAGLKGFNGQISIRQSAVTAGLINSLSVALSILVNNPSSKYARVT